MNTHAIYVRRSRENLGLNLGLLLLLLLLLLLNLGKFKMNPSCNICWKVKGKPRVEPSIGLLLLVVFFFLRNTYDSYKNNLRENIN